MTRDGPGRSEQGPPARPRRYGIPFNLPTRTPADLVRLAEALASDHLSGDGPMTRQAERTLGEILGGARVLLTTSCTHALEMAALLLDLQPGDEVILPAFTFVSTANAFVLRGARPVFADIRPDTLNLDEGGLERLITPRTRAIALVHYAGVACEMDTILAVAERHRLAVVEDNAHGLLGRYRGRLLGTLGTLATLSFHETKNLSCGEGGGLVVNDDRLVERAEIVREKGTNRSRFFRGQVDRYTWVDVGSSYVASDLLAALLCAQLDERDRIQAARQRIWAGYAEGLAGWAAAQGVRLPVVPPGCEHPAHLYYLLLPTLAARQALMAHLAAQDILAVFHYQPLHLSTMGLRFGGRPGDCPVTEGVADRLLRLPFYTALTEADQARVVDAVGRFRV